VASLKLVHSITSQEDGAAEGQIASTTLQAAIEGDREARRMLYLRFAPILVRVVHNATGNAELTKDVVQESFVTAFVSLHQLKSAEALRAWLIQIALSHARGHFRKEKLKRLLGLGQRAAFAEAPLLPNHLKSEAQADLRRAMLRLMDLDSRHRTAWMLRHIEAWSLLEISQSLHCSLATVKRWILVAEEALSRWAGET
jgi:RNA polymerase sigma-70 factor, ECF subfamily